MPVTTADLFNRALDVLGAQSIQTVNDSSNEARTCSRNWDISRRSVLRTHPWNFAIQRVALTSDGTTPAFDFTYAYPLPEDYLRLVMVDVDIDDWRIEANKLLTESTTVKIGYVADITDPQYFDTLCFEAVAYHLAWTICYKLTQSQTLKDAILKDLAGLLRQAKFVDSAEDPKKELDVDVWMKSRVGPAQGFVRDPMT